MEKQLIPQLRFPEFEDEYGKFEFSDITRRSKKSYNPNKDSENFPCVELESLTQETGQLIKTFDSINLKSNKTRFSKNEVLFGKLRPYLRKYLLTTFEGVCTSEIWVFQGQLVSNPFLYYLIQTDKFNFEANVSSGSKMPRTDWDYLSAIEFSIPKISKEQQKIASFLKDVDEVITKLTKKKELLEQYKKGVMQKIFHQELRFKDDEGNNFPMWQMKQVTSFAKTSIGLVTTMTKYYVHKDNGIPLIRNSDIMENKIRMEKLIYLDKVFSKAHSNRGLKYNDVVTVHTGEIGVSSVINKDLDGCHGFATLNTRIKNITEVLPSYLSWYFNSAKGIKFALSMATGDGRSNYNLKDFNKAIVPVPCLDEQTKIANFLSDIDVKIEALNTKIENSKTFKKGLLQQMFV